MCEISKVAEDWIVKGCHLHVKGVELIVRPNHFGGMVIRKGFAKIPDQEADTAIRMAKEWLAIKENRRKLSREVQKARKFILGESGHLKKLARARGAEFTFLLVALRRLGE